MSDRIVIASEMDAAFNDGLRAHMLGPHVIEAAADEPWRAAAEADVLLVRPTPLWRALTRPERRARPGSAAAVRAELLELAQKPL